MILVTFILGVICWCGGIAVGVFLTTRDHNESMKKQSNVTIQMREDYISDQLEAVVRWSPFIPDEALHYAVLKSLDEYTNQWREKNGKGRV